eukprot:scaffold11571_cov122-Cylindrotheca_fusiformis.AAC.17
MCLGDRRPTRMARAIDRAMLQRLALKQEGMNVDIPDTTGSGDLSYGNINNITEKETIDRHGNHHITVQHHYHDHSYDSPERYVQQQPARGGVVTPFPVKLHEMLRQLELDGHADIISWQPHGRCFVVHKPADFVPLLPKYFKLSKLASFQRQLNLYGFQRLTRGRDRGGYYHEFFLRSKPFLASAIQRTKVKGTGVRARSNPEQEPNFYSMPWVAPTQAFLPPSAFSPPAQSSYVTPDAPSRSAELEPPSTSSMRLESIEEDVVCSFGNKTFHFLDPHQMRQGRKARLCPEPVDDILFTDAERFFQDFYFPDSIGPEIEDDDIFGDILERMIG